MNASLMFVFSSKMEYLGLANIKRECKYAFSLFSMLLDAAYRNSPYKGLVVLVEGRGS